jgi:catechol 2,3-dioxygenase-like lactoylglutathione lyase family enzyme
VIEFIDHVAITVVDVDRTIRFYERVLGAELLHADAWRAGQMPVALLRLGGSRLSVHAAAAPASPHALRPTPGSVDICFRWGGTIASAVEHLARHGVEVELGPVGRPASDGTRGQSVYFRDPDANLVELLTVVQ